MANYDGISLAAARRMAARDFEKGKPKNGYPAKPAEKRPVSPLLAKLMNKDVQKNETHDH